MKSDIEAAHKETETILTEKVLKKEVEKDSLKERIQMMGFVAVLGIAGLTIVMMIVLGVSTIVAMVFFDTISIELESYEKIWNVQKHHFKTNDAFGDKDIVVNCVNNMFPVSLSNVTTKDGFRCTLSFNVDLESKHGKNICDWFNHTNKKIKVDKSMKNAYLIRGSGFPTVVNYIHSYDMVTNVLDPIRTSIQKNITFYDIQKMENEHNGYFYQLRAIIEQYLEKNIKGWYLKKLSIPTKEYYECFME